MTENVQQQRIRKTIARNWDEMLDEQWPQIWADYKAGQHGAEDPNKFAMGIGAGAKFKPEGAGHRVKTTLSFAAKRKVHIESLVDGQPELPGMGGEGETDDKRRD